MMTKEILERYYRGEASKEEQKLIEQWLDQADIEAPSAKFDSVESIDALGKELWAEISSTIDKPVQRRQINPIIYKIAASVVIAIVSVGLLFKRTSRPDTNVPADEQLSIRTASYNTVEHYKLDQGGMITFCGDMQIANKGLADYPVILETNCKSEATLKKRFLSQKGHVYIAVMFEHKKKEILVIDKEELRRETQPLPRRLISKLTKEFSI